MIPGKQKNVLWNVKYYSSAAISSSQSNVQASSTSTPEKIKENTPPVPDVPKKKLSVKLKEYSTALYNDYKDVFVETCAEAKEKPIKATIYIVLLGALGYCMVNVPSEKDFWDDLISKDVQLNSVGRSIRNPETEKHLRELTALRMKGMLRYQNLAVCSILWRHNNQESLGVYDATCKYTQPLWLEMWDRVVDIGFVGKWWIMEKSMEEYDINPQEWDSTPKPEAAQA